VNSSGNLVSDQILSAQYPSATPNDQWEQLVIAPGQSSQPYLNEFFLEIKAEPESDDGVYQQEGITLPNEGRVLVTPGQITGARDAAWGDWLDTITIGGG